jgi:hypothetical protein
MMALMPFSLWPERTIASALALAFVVAASQGYAAAQTTAPTESAPPASSAPDKSLSGLSVIINVESGAQDPVFHDDGYRVRIGASTKTTFAEPLKALSEVGPNTWMRFEGKLDDTGVLVASTAGFFPAGYRKNLTAMGPRNVKHRPDYQPVTKDSLLDADGRLVSVHTKVRYSDAGGACGWHKVPADQALQERVERIGMRLLPAYQRDLAPDDASKISFRFYVVYDDKTRGVFACYPGLVLVPKNVIERLHNDDQLAAVLADGVAFNLQQQLATMSPLEIAALGAETVGVFAPVIPALSGDVAGGILQHEITLKLERERARMSLQLMADAGYDPWQAPEAWRLLGPKDLPPDLQSLKYTREGEYQLSTLKAQYKTLPGGSLHVGDPAN